jgi:O-methyltransferase
VQTNDRGRLFYEALAVSVPDPRFIFLNHGYADIGRRNAFAWVRPSEFQQRFSLNLIRRLLRNIALKGKELLDVGCGRGGTSIFVSEYGGASKVVGLDSCRGNIEFCRQHYGSRRRAFVHASAEALPFQSGSFDVVTNVESSQHYSSLKSFVCDVHRVLRPRGWFCYADIFSPGEEVLREESLKECRFEIIASRDVTANVAAALRLDRKAAREFFESMLTTENQRILSQLYENVYFQKAAAYHQRHLLYWIWQCRKRSS